LFQGGDDPFISIISFIGDYDTGLNPASSTSAPHKIMDLALGEMKTDGFTQPIHHGMDLCTQPAFAASNGLVAALFALLFWAPALGWCVRSIVESIMAYLLSASALRG